MGLHRSPTLLYQLRNRCRFANLPVPGAVPAFALNSTHIDKTPPISVHVCTQHAHGRRHISSASEAVDSELRQHDKDLNRTAPTPTRRNPPNTYIRHVTLPNYGIRRLRLPGHTFRRLDIPNPAVRQDTNEFQPLLPHVYSQDSPTWEAADHIPRGLEFKRGSPVRVVSWNLNWLHPYPRERVSAGLAHLRHTFGEAPSSLVVMLQEVRQEMVQVMLENPWVQQNFMLSNVEPPTTLFAEDPSSSSSESDTRQIKWKATPYFTLMMISRDLPISNCFRVPFSKTGMGRDVLVVDIPVTNSQGSTIDNELFRLCTTHLESLRESRELRFSQLVLISELLKGAAATNGTIIGGIVGGDMGSESIDDMQYHKSTEVKLNDVWEDESMEPPISPKTSKRAAALHTLAKAYTWGYQPQRKEPKRLDKFFYTGSVETFPVEEAQDFSGKIGRLGIGVMAEVESPEYNADIEPELWVSDHLGIVIGVTVR
ncbi:Endonuclease/exonuclease/phosphatase [Xylaria sp. FL1777]|nr:Endonuclease/exonuclease/phosphatase [Xylaria sp. FL1777]